MRSIATGLILFTGLHALGLGPALWLRARAELPVRYLALLTVASTAILSYGVFWIAVVAPRARSIAVVVAAAASLAIALRLWRQERPSPALRLDAWVPSLIGGALAGVWLAPLLASPPIINDRLSWNLPVDNILPGLFAHHVVTGGGLRPFGTVGADRPTERPPLQAAVVVTVGTMARGVHEYEWLSTICQAQWFPALWLLGAASGLSGRRLAFCLAACALSGFFFVNTVYAWPKLFAASLMLGAFAMALELPSVNATANRIRTIAVVTLCALAILAHPGPAFTLIVLPVCWPALRPIVRLRPSWPAIGSCAIVATALFAPWLAYQVLVDPPTGTLVRDHLADGRKEGTALQAMVAANLDRPFGEHVRVRLGNLAAQLGDPTVALWPFPRQRAQQEQFFHHGGSLGLLLVGLLALFTPGPYTKDRPMDITRRLVVLAVVALSAWSLLEYEAGAAVIHSGSPVTTALLFYGGAVGLTRLPASLQLVALTLHGIAFLVIWLVPVLQSAAP